MFRGTTPKLELFIDADIELSACDEIQVTFENIVFKQSGPVFTICKDTERLEIDDAEKKISVVLTQAETLLLKPGKLKVQVRMLCGNLAYASEIGCLEVQDILGDGVIEKC